MLCKYFWYSATALSTPLYSHPFPRCLSLSFSPLPQAPAFVLTVRYACLYRLRSTHRTSDGTTLPFLHLSRLVLYFFHTLFSFLFRILTICKIYFSFFGFQNIYRPHLCLFTHNIQKISFFLIILHIVYVQKFLSGIRIPDMLQLEASFRTQQKGGYPQ